MIVFLNYLKWINVNDTKQTNLVKEVHRLQNINQQYRHQPNNQVLINAEKEKYSVLEVCSHKIQ